MKLRFAPIKLLLLLLSVSCSNSTGDKGVSIVFNNNEATHRFDVIMDGKLFTSFTWPDNVYKPILYPVYTAAGTEITRGFPLIPGEGERNDHIHQVGIWFNYGNVNGYDFWGNGYRGVKEPNGGVIKHLSIDRIIGGPGDGSFVSTESWLVPSGNEIISEKSEYHFIGKGTTRIIDRITTLSAGDSAVHFKDTKEGMFAIRLARELEMPSNEGVILLDAEGNPSSEKDTLNKGVTGNYRSSEGISGEAVWGTRAKWMELSGIKGNEKISVVICDHPKNPGYPTYWHARGYGLFSANPLGWKDFTNGEKVKDFSIPPKKSVKFRYRIIISSGNYLTDNEINVYFDEFSKKYK